MGRGSSGSSIHRECGYEIHFRGGETLLVNRRTWPLMMAMCGVVGIAIVFFGAGLVLQFSSTAEGTESLRIALLAAGSAFALLLWRLAMTYRRRRDLPLEEVAEVAVIEATTGVLRDLKGAVLCPLSSAKVAVRIAWFDGSRWLMRNVVLTWPGGRRVAFKTPSKRKAHKVAVTLRDAVRLQ